MELRYKLILEQKMLKGVHGFLIIHIFTKFLDSSYAMEEVNEF